MSDNVKYWISGVVIGITYTLYVLFQIAIRQKAKTVRRKV